MLWTKKVVVVGIALGISLFECCLWADSHILRVGDPKYLGFYTETPQHSLGPTLVCFGFLTCHVA